MTEKNRVLVFAGTYEGYRLAELLGEDELLCRIDFSVATEYGVQGFKDKRVNVLPGRKDRHEIEKLLRSAPYSLAVDASHPYADKLTENLIAACADCGTEYLRVLRAENVPKQAERQTCEGEANILWAADADAAAALLAREAAPDEGIFLTTGAKEIGKYAGLAGFENRVIARVLPSCESIGACLEAGLPAKNIICMQGPFTREMNAATMRQYGCKWLVTKSTGKPGGFEEKAALAKEGFRIVVIERPLKEEGCTPEEAAVRIKEELL